MYRICANNRKKGWEEIDKLEDKEQALKIAAGISPKNYSEYIVIENVGNGDVPIEVKFLDYKKNDFKDRLKVEIPKTRAEKKQEFRKEIEDYAR